MDFVIVNSAVSYVRLARELVAGFELVPAPAPGELELGHELEPKLEPAPELELEPEPEPAPELGHAPEPIELVGAVGAGAGAVGAVAYVAYVEADTSALEGDLELEHAAASDVAQQLAVLRQPVARFVQGRALTEMDKPLGA